MASTSRGALMLVGAALFILARPAQASYTVTDLGTLGGNIAFPAQMSNSYIVGGSLTNGQVERGFRWDSVNGMVRLNGLGGDDLVAFGVNSAGSAVGLSYQNDHTTEHAVQWAAGSSSATDLGVFTNGDYSEAFGIDTNGLIVGNGNTNGGSNYHGAEWTNGVISDVGTLPGGQYSVVYAVNDSGQACGGADTVMGTGASETAGEHAFLLNSGTLQDLGTLGGRNSTAFAINSSGQVVGLSDTSITVTNASGAQHAFLWNGVTMQDLGTLPGYNSYVALSINDTGQVTGEAYSTATQTYTGFVWTASGGMVDVNTLVPAMSFHLSDVINNNLGWLAAVGDDGNGHKHVFLLQP